MTDCEKNIVLTDEGTEFHESYDEIAGQSPSMTEEKELELYIQNLIENGAGEPEKPITYTHNEIIELIKPFNFILARKPKNKHLKLSDKVSFREKDSPIVYRAELSLILEKKNDKSVYERDNRYRLTVDEINENAKKRNEAINRDRLRREEEFRQKLAKEDCTLTDRYETVHKPVHYSYKGYDYKVSPKCWNQGARPHLAKYIRYTQKHVEQLFADEECELLSQYQNQKSWLSYKYHDKVYRVQFNDWRYLKVRPHLK